jgi:hypothetical protein
VETLNFESKCRNCKKAAQGSLGLIITSVITQVFQITTDLQRSTRFGDLNCQKTFGLVTSLYGFISTIFALKAAGFVD